MSARPTTNQPEGAGSARKAEPITELPNGPPMYHANTWLVTEFCQTISGWPSPLRSPMPANDQPGIAGNPNPPRNVSPSGPPMYHTKSCAAAALCQIRSEEHTSELQSHSF